MSELIDTHNVNRSARLKLLACTSFAVLAMSPCLCTSAAATDGPDQPTVWIELGGQLDRVDGGEERFNPPFTGLFVNDPFKLPTTIQRPPRYAIGEEATVSFQPSGTNWHFSVALRYGRSNGAKASHEETPVFTAYNITSAPTLGLYQKRPELLNSRKFLDTAAKHNESHTILDFRAGKDVGLGLFGPQSTTLLTAGIRFAQFSSQNSVSISGDPDFSFSYHTTHFPAFPLAFRKLVVDQKWHVFNAKEDAKRAFHGLGPSVSWDETAVVLGNTQSAAMTIDWGMNAAALFGRQKAHTHHQTNAESWITYPAHTIYNHSNSYEHNRTRSVVVPNLGGFAGVSLKFPNAKISLGYRADLFWGAVDGGIDSPKSEDRNFYGPFATISIGLGG